MERRSGCFGMSEQPRAQNKVGFVVDSLRIYSKIARMKTIEKFTAHWIGRCPAKGCKCVIHVDIPMIRERWTETHHNHAHGYSYPVPKSRNYPDNQFGQYFMPSHLALACVTHRRNLAWTPINGRFVETHVCDARCMNAIGPNCECSCGGANHGRGHHVELKFN